MNNFLYLIYLNWEKINTCKFGRAFLSHCELFFRSPPKNHIEHITQSEIINVDVENNIYPKASAPPPYDQLRDGIKEEVIVINEIESDTISDSIKTLTIFENQNEIEVCINKETTSVFCNCKSFNDIGLCFNNRCTCRKAGKNCSAKCHFKNKKCCANKPV